MKNPSTTGSAGRSDPARDACGRPRAFHLLVFHTSHHCWFLGKPICLMGSLTLAYAPSALATAFGRRFFLLLNWGPVCPNRPLSGRAGRSPPGMETGHTGPTGGNQGACVICGRLAEESSPSAGRNARDAKIPLEGGRDWCHLPGLSKGCKEAMRTSVLFCLHTICRRFDFSKHKMRKCTPCPFAPLHPSFFSQPNSTRC